MPSLADVVQQMGPSITYDERTRRFHDMEQNYRMVSTKGVISGSPARSNGNAASGYVTQDAFNSFRSEIYLYISKVASFTREALVEMQRTMAGEQRDTDSLRNEERRNAEERRERRTGALTRISSGVRQATGMGPLGALFTGLATSLIGVLANVDIDKLRETFDRIGSVFDSVREFFNKLQEYSNIILAIGAALAAMVAANMLDRTPKPPRGGGKPSGGGGRPAGPGPGAGSGGASSGAKPATGGATGATGATGAAAGAAGAAAGAKPTTPPPPPPPAQPQVKPGYSATETPSGTRYRSEKTGRFVKSSEALTEPGAPTREPKPTQPTPGQPTQERPMRSKASRLRLSGFLAALGPAIDILSARSQLESLSEQRDAESIDEEKYKDEVIKILGGTAGSIIGGLAGGALGTLLGPAGSMIGAFAGSIGGERLGEWLATTGVGKKVGELIYDRFFLARPTNVPEAQIISQLTELQRRSRAETSAIDEMVNLTERAANEGRITSSQARQLNEVGSQIRTTDLRAGDIEQAINMMQFSGMEGINYNPTTDRSGRVVVLPTIYQEVATPRSSQPAARPTPETSSEIQTRTPDGTLGEAAAATNFGGGQQQSRRGNLARRIY